MNGAPTAEELQDPALRAAWAKLGAHVLEVSTAQANYDKARDAHVAAAKAYRVEIKRVRSAPEPKPAQPRKPPVMLSTIDPDPRVKREVVAFPAKSVEPRQIAPDPAARRQTEYPRRSVTASVMGDPPPGRTPWS